MELKNEYIQFLNNKIIHDVDTGIKNIPELNKELFDFQSVIVKWALRR